MAEKNNTNRNLARNTQTRKFSLDFSKTAKKQLRVQRQDPPNEPLALIIPGEAGRSGEKRGKAGKEAGKEAGRSGEKR
jgi:hypothetical protein